MMASFFLHHKSALSYLDDQLEYSIWPEKGSHRSDGFLLQSTFCILLLWGGVRTAMELRICPVATLKKSIQYPKAKRCTIYHGPNLSTRQQSSLKKNWGRSQNSESELWKDPNGSPQITLSLMLKAFKGQKKGPEHPKKTLSNSPSVICQLRMGHFSMVFARASHPVLIFTPATLHRKMGRSFVTECYGCNKNVDWRKCFGKLISCIALM